MFFEKDKYYKYIGTLEKIVDFYYVILAILGALIGLAIWKIIGLIIGIFVGLLITRLYTLKTKIQIQNMRWKMDIYENIKQK